MSKMPLNGTLWTCDRCGASTIRDTRPKGWTEVPVYFGPELHSVEHRCRTCGTTPDSAVPNHSEPQ